MRVDHLNRLIRDGQTLEGEWEITPRHKIRYRRKGNREELNIVGDLAGAGPNSLAFRLNQESQDGDTRKRQLELKGRWQADAQNRLTFRAEQERGPEEVLTLEGAWELGAQNEILYRFKRTDLKTRSRSLHLIRFDGFWELGEDRRLAYVLDTDSGSAFRFRGAFQTASVLQKRGSLRYQLGVEAAGRGEGLKSVTLFGKWKLSRDLALEFEVPYAGGFHRAITFGAAYAWDPKTSVTARLTTLQGSPLGLELSLHREFLNGNGQAFVRLRRSLEETAAETGVRVRW